MRNECRHLIMVCINKNYFIRFLINLLWGKINWAIFDENRKDLLPALRKCKTDFHWILVYWWTQNFPVNWLFSYLLRKTLSRYPSFSRYHPFECGSVQNTTKKMVCPYKGKTPPTSIHFLIDQFIDRFPAVCPTDILRIAVTTDIILESAGSRLRP